MLSLTVQYWFNIVNKMYILIQWVKKPHEVTVMKEPDNIKRYNDGDIVKINYPNKGLFSGRLISRSGNKTKIIINY